jgi:hypothetical protein
MQRTGLTSRYWLTTLALTTAFWAAPAIAQTTATPAQDQGTMQSAPAQNPVQSPAQTQEQQPQENQQVQQNGQMPNNEPRNNDARSNDAHTTNDPRDNDITRREVVDMGQFLRDHPEVAEQLQKDPKLIDNQRFVDDHPQLHQFLAAHPHVREQFDEHPYAFMHDEDRLYRDEHGNGNGNGNDITRREVVDMGQFLKDHPEVAEQLQKNPKLIDDKRFVDDHPQLHQFLAEHPHVREQFDQHPYAFMRDEDRLYRDQHGNGNGNDITRREVGLMNGFLNDHREVAEQLQKDPRLIDDQKYVDNHPELHAFLADHPEVRQQFDEHPDAFMKDEDRYQRWNNGKNDVPGTTTPPKTATKLPGTGTN